MGGRGGPTAGKRLLAGSQSLAGLDPPPGGWGGVGIKKSPAWGSRNGVEETQKTTLKQHDEMGQSLSKKNIQRAFSLLRIQKLGWLNHHPRYPSLHQLMKGDKLIKGKRGYVAGKKASGGSLPNSWTGPGGHPWP